MSDFKGWLTAVLSISAGLAGKVSMNTVTISRNDVIRAEDGVTFIVAEDGTHIGF